MFRTTYRIFVFLSLILLCILWGCKKNPVEPETPQPGRRDYVWNVDTLDMPMNYIASVWGALPNDVWAVGAGGTYNDRLLHYDGERWTTYKKEPIWCGGQTLYGFSRDNVWMGGDAGWLEHGAGIWHYDGTKWSQNYVYDVEGSYAMEVQDIWGPAPNNIYASGVISFYDGENDDFRGFLLHYNGDHWNPIIKEGPYNSQFLRVRSEENKLFVQFFHIGRVSNDTDKYEFYEIKEDGLSSLYSTTQGGFNIVDGKVYFVDKQNIYRYSNGKLIQWLTVSNPNFGYQIYGKSKNDLFLRMKDGLAHYNGSDIEYIYNFTRNNTNINANAVLFQKEVFFCALGKNLENLILHGKLKE